jgi:hypothetical protein
MARTKDSGAEYQTFPKPNCQAPGDFDARKTLEDIRIGQGPEGDCGIGSPDCHTVSDRELLRDVSGVASTLEVPGRRRQGLGEPHGRERQHPGQLRDRSEHHHRDCSCGFAAGQRPVQHRQCSPRPEAAGDSLEACYPCAALVLRVVGSCVLRGGECLNLPRWAPTATSRAP